jgi:hypothetical protein
VKNPGATSQEPEWGLEAMTENRRLAEGGYNCRMPAS